MDFKRPPFSDDVSLHLLKDVGVVFDEGAQELYELNTTATFIWCSLEEGLTASDLTKALSDTFSFSAAEAEKHVAETLEGWQNLGLLGDTPPEREKENAQNALDKTANNLKKNIKRTFSIFGQNRGSERQRRYRTLGEDTRIHFPSLEIESLVHPIVSHLEPSSAETRRPSREIEIREGAEGFVIFVDGNERSRCNAANEVAPLIHFLVFEKGIREENYRATIHAAAVADGERALIMPGRPGSGKTSLTAALLTEGFQYLTDDFGFLVGDKMELKGLPFSLCIKESGVPTLAEFYPALQDLAVHHRVRDQKKVRYLTPPQTSFSFDQNRTYPVSWAVFPRYEPDGVTELSLLPRSEALRRLLQTCKLTRPMTKPQVSCFIQWLRSLQSYELKHACLRDGVACIKEIFEGPAVATEREGSREQATQEPQS